MTFLQVVHFLGDTLEPEARKIATLCNIASEVISPVKRQRCERLVLAFPSTSAHVRCSSACLRPHSIFEPKKSSKKTKIECRLATNIVKILRRILRCKMAFGS